MCCEAIDQNFDCGSILKKELQYRKFGITGLKSSLEQLKNMHVAMITLILPQDIAFQI